jgi:hypothetical protein
MKFIAATLFFVVLGAFSFGRASAPTSQTQMFHVRGTVTDPIGAVIPNGKLTFQSGQSIRTLITNNLGAYDADLPPGAYTMKVQVNGFRTYYRPLFRVTSPTAVTFDVSLQVDSCGDMIVANSSGKPVSNEQYWEATKFCAHEDVFPVPSNGGLAFEVSIQFGTRTVDGSAYAYEGEKSPYELPVFVAYNLFSMRADKVIYYTKSGILLASGNVLVQDETGERQVDSITFKVDDGRATQIY